MAEKHKWITPFTICCGCFCFVFIVIIAVAAALQNQWKSLFIVQSSLQKIDTFQINQYYKLNVGLSNIFPPESTNDITLTKQIELKNLIQNTFHLKNEIYLYRIHKLTSPSYTDLFAESLVLLDEATVATIINSVIYNNDIFIILLDNKGIDLKYGSPTYIPDDSYKNVITKQPTWFPTYFPTTELPTNYPTTGSPTHYPTTRSPTNYPTHYPTTKSPTQYPTNYPTTLSPTPQSGAPTKFPTTGSPTKFPTTRSPTKFPTHYPTNYPTSKAPTPPIPTPYPVYQPPTFNPTLAPTDTPRPTTTLEGQHQQQTAPPLSSTQSIQTTSWSSSTSDKSTPPCDSLFILAEGVSEADTNQYCEDECNSRSSGTFICMSFILSISDQMYWCELYSC